MVSTAPAGSSATGPRAKALTVVLRPKVRRTLFDQMRPSTSSLAARPAVNGFNALARSVVARAFVRAVASATLLN